MPTVPTHDDSFDLPEELNLDDLKSSATNACRNIDLMEKHNMVVDNMDNTDSDDPFSIPLPKPLTPRVKTTASLLQIYSLLREYGDALNATPSEVRNTVVNKLLLELENPDPKVRLKALELLGSVPGIDLFGAKRAPAEDKKPDTTVQDRLKERLRKLKEGVESAEGVYEAEQPAPDEEKTA